MIFLCDVKWDWDFRVQGELRGDSGPSNKSVLFHLSFPIFEGSKQLKGVWPSGFCMYLVSACNTPSSRFNQGLSQPWAPIFYDFPKIKIVPVSCPSPVALDVEPGVYLGFKSLLFPPNLARITPRKMGLNHEARETAQQVSVCLECS